MKRLDLFKSIPKPVCSACGNADISPAAEYCIICGASFIIKHKKGVKIIEYPSPKADARQRAVLCVICINEEFTENAEFCRICGLPLYNRCVYDLAIARCGHANPLNARHCELCGSQTKYSTMDLFRMWTDERDEYITEKTQKKGRGKNGL